MHHLATSFPFLLVPIRNEMPRLSFIFEASSSRDLTVRNGGEKMSTALRRVWRFLGLGTTRSYCIVLHVFGFTCFALIRTMNSQHAIHVHDGTWLCVTRKYIYNSWTKWQTGYRNASNGSMTFNDQKSTEQFQRAYSGTKRGSPWRLGRAFILGLSGFGDRLDYWSWNVDMFDGSGSHSWWKLTAYR